ncbi:hypothetical protein [Legionella cincinnatiensis]|uniref:Uncharacterized protein n=1 Tax=Legionella cincinnatiensis TaxID=28085 RepID=A0A378IMU0_9GAMM|nr:hypothetical protein [Legionella cincinnatiensis]KTC85285.1 hypothetical protein Lcin_1785 [Legionella cincinnatiensis]STX36353.1 Uncharacterised protein [Legionella cincinnatiensis]
MKFFGRSKNKKVYNNLEDKAQKQEVHHEDTSLKQIDAQLKQLKKQRKRLTSPNIAQVCGGVLYMGVPVGIPPAYFAPNNSNNREIASLDRQIDQLEETRYRMTHPSSKNTL